MNQEGLFYHNDSKQNNSLTEIYAAVNQNKEQVHNHTQIGESADALTKLIDNLSESSIGDWKSVGSYLEQKIKEIKENVTNELITVGLDVEKKTVLNRYNLYKENVESQFTTVEGKIEELQSVKNAEDAQVVLNEIKDILQTEECANVLSELPYQVLEGEVSKEEITGDIQNADYSPEDEAAPKQEDLVIVAETELSDTSLDEIKDIKTTLGAYNYVRNNISYEAYYGSRKGAEGALAEKTGNDYDQASLLIGILRKIGVPAHYVRGNVILSVEQTKKWTATDDIDVALNILAALRVPTVALTCGGKVQAVRVEHVWVEAYVPYKEFRTSAKNSSKKVWVLLDPSYKENNAFEGINVSKEIGLEGKVDFLDYEDNFAGLGDAQVSRVGIDSVQDILDNGDSNLEQYIKENGLEDADIIEAFGGKKIVQRKEKRLPLSLPYEVEEVFEQFNQIPDSYCDAITIAIKGNSVNGKNIGGSSAFSETLKASDLYGKRITLSYAPATEQDAETIAQYGDIFHVPCYLVNMIPQLCVDGKVVASGKACGLGNKQSLTMTVTSPKSDASVIDNIVTVGGIYCIALDYGNVAANELKDITSNLDGLKEKLTEDNIYSEVAMGQILNAVAKSYFAQLDLYDIILAGQNNVTQTRALSVGMTGYDVQVKYLFQVPSEVTEGTIYIDIDHDIKSVVSNKKENDLDNKKAFMLQSGYFASAMEHRVLEQMTGVESVSTIKALQEANEKGIPICTVTKDNYSSIIDTIEASNAVKEDIRNSVNANKIVIISQKQVTIFGWTGSGYIVLDTDTFAAGYMISGGLAGGAMTVPQVLSKYAEYVISGLVQMVVMTVLESIIAAFIPGGWGVALIWGIRIALMSVYIYNIYMLIQLYEITGDVSIIQEICIQIAAMCTCCAIRLGPAKEAFESLQTLSYSLAVLAKTGASTETCLLFLKTYGLGRVTEAKTAIGLLQKAGCSENQLAVIGQNFEPDAIVAIENAFAKIGVVTSAEIDAVIIMFKNAGSAQAIVPLADSLAVCNKAGFNLAALNSYGIGADGLPALVNAINNGISLPSVEGLWKLGIPATSYKQLGITSNEIAQSIIENGGMPEPDTPGVYTTTIKWANRTVQARPYGKGYFGTRTEQSDPRAEALELKTNPNGESYYIDLGDGSGSMVQFENMKNGVLQDCKCVQKANSIYFVKEKPAFLQNKILQEATRQLTAANNAGYKVEWLVSDQKAVSQLQEFFDDKGLDIIVTYFPE